MVRLSMPVLATTVHDPGGQLLPGIRRLTASLREVFGGFGVFASTQTHADVVAALADELGATIDREVADGSAGRHRRMALRLATKLAPSRIMHSDLDHVLRWIEADPAELQSSLTNPDADFVVVGRTADAMAACPARLRETERIVNHIYRLAAGRDWDVMFAVRSMAPAAAAAMVAHGTEDTIANDVEWPILAERLGFSVAYREADGLSYRVTRDFDFAHDNRDDDPIEWANRVELASLHARALRRLLS